MILGYHSFSTYSNFSEKLTFLTPWYVHAHTKWMIPKTASELHKNFTKFHKMSIAEFTYSTLITLSCSSLSISFNWSFSVLISVPTFFIFCSCKWWKQMIQFLSMMTSEFSFASAKIILVETRFHILNMLSSFLTWKYIKVLLK